MAVNRRMGKRDSATFNVLLDATEQVLEEEGYGSATSRRIATVAGVRQQLVYYYFLTMDDLLLATFRRRTERALSRLREEVTDDEPIRALWRFLTVTTNGRLSFEFMALSNHHEGLREEIARYVLEARRISTEAIARQLGERGSKVPIKAAGMAFLMDCAALLLRREESSGITLGHGESLEFIEWMLDQVA